jgi:hypothetical protein
VIICEWIAKSKRNSKHGNALVLAWLNSLFCYFNHRTV